MRRRPAIRVPAFAAVAASVLLAAIAAAPAHAAFRLPPHDTRSVYDFASVIKADDAAQMERWHRALYDQTGVAIVVVTVPDLEGEPIEDFATRVGSEWGVGKKGKDLGVVVALSLNPRRIQVATGYGAEAFLPDGKVGGLIDSEARPLLRQGDYSAGLRQLSAALTAVSAKEFGLTIEGLSEQSTPAHRSEREDGSAPSVLFLIALVVLFMVGGPILRAILFAGMRNAGRRGRGGFGGGWGMGGFGGGGFGGGFGGGGFGGFGGGGFGGGGAGRGF